MSLMRLKYNFMTFAVLVPKGTAILKSHKNENGEDEFDEIKI